MVILCVVIIVGVRHWLSSPTGTKGKMQRSLWWDTRQASAEQVGRVIPPVEEMSDDTSKLDEQLFVLLAIEESARKSLRTSTFG